jgi:hypothetical protein
VSKTEVVRVSVATLIAKGDWVTGDEVKLARPDVSFAFLLYFFAWV